MKVLPPIVASPAPSIADIPDLCGRLLIGGFELLEARPGVSYRNTVLAVELRASV